MTNPLTGCVSKDSNYVTINPLPTPNAGPDKEICSGDGSVNLTGSPVSPPGEWRSLSNLGVIGMPGAYLFDPKQSGITDKSKHYLVYRYTDTKGCVNEDTMIMTVYITPVVKAGTYERRLYRWRVRPAYRYSCRGYLFGPGSPVIKFNLLLPDGYS
jgi:hypothetical protein